MKKAFFVSLIIFLCINLYAQSDDNVEPPIQSNAVPLSLAFHNIGWNLFDSITYNYGLNFIGAGLGTWAIIETETDLRWRNFAYNHSYLSNGGLSALYIGFAVPAITPVALYILGRNNQDKKLQITALALTQSLILTLGVQSPLKMLTGREEPGIIDKSGHTRGTSTDDNSRKFNWFNKDFIRGWPSGHTANAFSAAATISEIYKDNLYLQIGAYSYAALIGFGVSVNVHWSSEVFAGALIGYAIGKTVGKSFNQLLEKDEPDNNLSFFIIPNGAGVTIRF